MEVHGELAADPRARALAAEVERVQRRYAEEVVAAFGLCPFLRDVESGFGRFCVFLDPEPDLGRTVSVALAGEGVAHLIFPLTTLGATAFERFGAAVGAALKQRAHPSGGAPVIATFHPTLSGDSSSPHRLVGLLRRAPDPFIQLVPAGLHQGGTVFAGAAQGASQPDHGEETFARLRGVELERLLSTLSDVRADRDRSYAPYLQELSAMGAGPSLHRA